MNCIKNAKVYVEGEGVKLTDLVFDERTVGFDGKEYPDANVIELNDDCVVLPAFIDEHIHGRSGSDFSDGGNATRVIAENLPSEGTAYFLGTTMTIPRNELLTAVKDFGDYYAEKKCDGAVPLGLHLEGPFISHKHIGAQNIDGLSACDEKYFDELVERSQNSVKLMTVAPELNDITVITDRANEYGVLLSAGHTDCTVAELKKSGINCATHLFNAMRALHHREGGTVGGALLDDEIYVEVIADGIHVFPDVLKLVKKIKPRSRIVFITDSIRAKGLPDGMSSLGGQDVYVRNGEARLGDGTLAGSVLKMNDAFKNAITLMNATVEEASDYCSKNPATHLGLDSEIGGIKTGKKASYVILNGRYDVVATICEGKLVYGKI